MARTLFTVPPRLFAQGETVSPLVNLHQQFSQIVVFMDVPTPDATVNFDLHFEVTTDGGANFTQLFATSGNLPMLGREPGTGNIITLPFYTWTFALFGPGGVISFDKDNQYRARLTLNKPFTLGFRIGGDSYMAVSVDIAAVVSSTSSVASITVNLTIGASANFLVSKLVGFITVPNITSENWNTSEALTSRITAVNAGGSDAAIYTLANPTTGAHSLVVNFSPNTPFGVVVTAISFNGVSVPGNTATVTSTQSSPISAAITVASGGMAVDCLNVNGASHAPAVPAGSQVNDWTPTTWGDQTIGASTLLDATAMGWSWTGGATPIAQAVLELTAAAVGGGGSGIYGDSFMTYSQFERAS